MGKAKKQEKAKRKKEADRLRRPALWEACKAKHGLTDEEVSMAKNLCLVPESLIRLPVSPDEKWKQPVKAWIRSEHGKLLRKRRVREKMKARRNAGNPADAQAEINTGSMMGSNGSLTAQH